jgi:3-dehydroquinate synthase
LENGCKNRDRTGFYRKYRKQNNSLIVTDETISNLDFGKTLKASGIKTLVLGSGEKFKNLSSIEKIASAAVDAGLDRDAVIIGVGGGVICDMAAFAASVYMRGCGVMLVPTTLLSMVDASIGGKTGVDFLEKKNLVGSFYPAERVLISTAYLKTLSEAEFKSGLAEIIKHAFLSGEKLLSYIEEHRAEISNRTPDVMAELIYESLKVKAEYIRKDFREQGIRAHLNLGHTFGHALETAAGLGRFTHGEAVAWGIFRAMKAGLAAGITSMDYAERAEKILRDYGYNIDFADFDIDVYMNALFSDKKKKSGRLRFILQESLGTTMIMNLDDKIIEEVLKN